MNQERHSFLAYRMRPQRVVVSTGRDGNGKNNSILDCGHSVETVAHFSVKAGEYLPCNDCGFSAASKLPEFS